MKFTPTTIHTMRISREQWDEIFAGNQRAVIVPDERAYSTGHWLDLKRSTDYGEDVPMFATDGVEQRLLVKVTHIIGGQFFTMRNDPTRTDSKPLDPYYLVLSIKRL